MTDSNVVISMFSTEAIKNLIDSDIESDKHLKSTKLIETIKDILTDLQKKAGEKTDFSSLSDAIKSGLEDALKSSGVFKQKPIEVDVIIPPQPKQERKSFEPDTPKPLINFSKSLGEVIGNLSGKLLDFSSKVNHLDGSFAGFIGLIPGAGDKLKELASHVDISINSYKTLADQGAFFGGSLMNMRDTVAASGLDFDKFTDAMARGSQGLKIIGPERFAVLNRSLTDTIGKFGSFGYSTEETAEYMSDYIETLRKAGKLKEASNTDLSDAVERNMIATTKLSAELGISRKELEKKKQTVLDDDQVGLLASMLKPEQATAITGVVAQAESGGYAEQAKAFLARGQLAAKDEKNMAFMKAAPELVAQLLKIHDDLHAGTVHAEGYLSQIQTATEQDRKKITREEASAVTTVGGSSSYMAGVQAAWLSLMRDTRLQPQPGEPSKGTAAEQAMTHPEEVTAKLLNLESDAQRVHAAAIKTTNDALKSFSGGLDSIAKSLGAGGFEDVIKHLSEATTDFLNKLNGNANTFLSGPGGFWTILGGITAALIPVVLGLALFGKKLAVLSEMAPLAFDALKKIIGGSVSTVGKAAGVVAEGASTVATIKPAAAIVEGASTAGTAVAEITAGTGIVNKLLSGASDFFKGIAKVGGKVASGFAVGTSVIEEFAGKYTDQIKDLEAIQNRTAEQDKTLERLKRLQAARVRGEAEFTAGGAIAGGAIAAIPGAVTGPGDIAVAGAGAWTGAKAAGMASMVAGLVGLSAADIAEQNEKAKMEKEGKTQPITPTVTPEPITPTVTPAPITPTVTPAPITPTVTPAPITPTVTPAPITPTVTPAPITPTVTPAPEILDQDLNTNAPPEILDGISKIIAAIEESSKNITGSIDKINSSVSSFATPLSASINQLGSTINITDNITKIISTIQESSKNIIDSIDKNSTILNGIATLQPNNDKTPNTQQHTSIDQIKKTIDSTFSSLGFNTGTHLPNNNELPNGSTPISDKQASNTDDLLDAGLTKQYADLTANLSDIFSNYNSSLSSKNDNTPKTESTSNNPPGILTTSATIAPPLPKTADIAFDAIDQIKLSLNDFIKMEADEIARKTKQDFDVLKILQQIADAEKILKSLQDIEDAVALEITLSNQKISRTDMETSRRMDTVQQLIAQSRGSIS